MDIKERWEKALKLTEIIRARILPLSAFESTHMPYIFLAESAMNCGDTVVRTGEVMLERPSIILPFNMPQFEGFEFEKYSALEQDMLTSFLLVRGIRFPSLKYQNKTDTLDIFEGRLKEAIDHYARKLQREENTSTGIVAGPEDCWQYSVLVFICSQVLKSADGDIRTLLDNYKRKDSDL